MSTATSIRQALPGGLVEGTCDPAFAPLADEFVRNFTDRGEVGASLCLTLQGRTLVDLWGGMAKPKEGIAWKEDTVSIVFSCTKGATALCAHVLKSRGALDIEAPVSAIWPEFATAGKEAATVRMMLDHSVGVPALRGPIAGEDIYDWDYMTGRLAAEAPFWQPGIRNGYHGFTFGWTVGEIVRRVSGRSLGRFFQEAVAGPLGLDFWIGLPEAIEPRVAPMIYHLADAGERDASPFLQAALGDKNSIAALFLFNVGVWRQGGANTRAGHAAEIGAANGITNGRGLAGMYAPLACGGSLDGVDLVDPDTLAMMGEVSMATHQDATLMIPTRFALGFMKSMDNRRRIGPNQSALLGRAAFGHVGAGGSIGFADPECGLSFGYTMNKMGPGLLLNDRGQALVDAAYRCLGYRGNASGVWLK